MCRCARHGDWAEARRIHERYLELFRVNFITSNPVPVKAALAEMGLINDILRQPLLPLDDATAATTAGRRWPRSASCRPGRMSAVA